MLVAMGKDRIATLRNRGLPDANLYGETQLGGLGLMYALTDPPSVFNLPEAPKVATRSMVGSWLSGLLTAGIVAAVPFWLLFRRRETLAAATVAETATADQVPPEEAFSGERDSSEPGSGGGQ
jgi:formate dehydrogenase iron-sulfur subunit